MDYENVAKSPKIAITHFFRFGFTISEVYVTRSNYFSYFSGTNKN